MHDEFLDKLDRAMRTNNELSMKLQHAESRNANLLMDLQRLKANYAMLVNKLDIANGEIGRLTMLLKHNSRLRGAAKTIEGAAIDACPPVSARHH